MTTPTGQDARTALARVRVIAPADAKVLADHIDQQQRRLAGLQVDIENLRARIAEASETALDRAALEQAEHFVVVGPGREPIAFVTAEGLAAAGKQLARDLAGSPTTTDQAVRRITAAGIEYGPAVEAVYSAAIIELVESTRALIARVEEFTASSPLWCAIARPITDAAAQGDTSE